MRFVRYLLPVLFVFFGLNSCLITDNIKTIQLEIMKPGIFVLPEDVDTIAVISRDFFKSDTCTLIYSKLGKNYADSTIKYRDLSNRCVDALSEYLEKEGYFRKVFNYRDSLNYLWNNPEQPINRAEFFNKTRSDICVFLDYFNFNHTYIATSFESYYTRPSLAWTMVIRSDTSYFIYNQLDTLMLDNPSYPKDPTKTGGMKLFLLNSSEYLGKIFGSQIIPSWLKVERMYYKSKNPDMLKAEKFALNNEWLDAAELWNKETKNKNHRIAAKACYNMALACEMEGKPDLSIDWLVKSYTSISGYNLEHKTNCQRYINILAIRKKEIEKVGKQIRSQVNKENK